MSEPIGMSIDIGGELPASKVQELLDTIKDTLGDLQGPTSEEELRQELKQRPLLFVNGVSNYGQCDGLIAFCKENNLSYKHHSEAKYEYDAMVSFWTPGMKEPINLTSNADGDCLVEEVRGHQGCLEHGRKWMWESGFPPALRLGSNRPGDPQAGPTPATPT